MATSRVQVGQPRGGGGSSGSAAQRRRCQSHCACLPAAFLLYGAGASFATLWGAGGGAKAPTRTLSRASELEVEELPTLTAVESEDSTKAATAKFEGPSQPKVKFSVGDVVDGRVAFKMRKTGVFVDIGLNKKNAFLDAPLQLAMKLKRHQILRGLRVESFNEMKRRVVVVCDNLTAQIKGPNRLISNFTVGEIVDGRVVYKKRGTGVFVDIGARKNALLLADHAVALKLEDNEKLRGLRVKEADEERGRLIVAYDGLKEHIKARYRPVSDFSAGDVVDGKVVDKNEIGVFLDIGAQENFRLKANKTMASKLKLNERLQGLRVDVAAQGKGGRIVTYDGLEAFVSGRP